MRTSVCLTAWLSRTKNSGIGQQGPISPASRRVRSNPKQAACQPRWLAKLERKYHARDHYPAVSGLQEPELFDDEEQEDDHGTVGVLQVLQHVPEAYGAQRDQVTIGSQLSVVSKNSFELRTESG